MVQLDYNTLNTQYSTLNSQISNFNHKTIDLATANARLGHEELNVKSINIQTMILAIILVILITIAFTIHLQQ
jgi:hypothetical protein